jgi:uncharacterized membrane protein (DUF4010 family)
VNPGLENLLSRIALAFGIGMLIGLERGWRTRDAQPGSRTAGVRTFAISGLLGGIVGALAGGGGAESLSVAGAIVIGAAFAAFAAVITVFGRAENQATGARSAATTIAALLTFVLGVYAAIGSLTVAAAAAVAAAGVLVIREELHGWVRRLTLKEFESVLVLLAMTFIALPTMPNRPIGPYGGVNPRDIWLIAITLATLSFAGFVAVRALGERRGVLVASTLGGIVSSTAVIFANARAAAGGTAGARVLAAGVSLATAVSMVRVLAIAMVLNHTVGLIVVAPLAAAAFAALGFAWVAMRGQAGARVLPPEFSLTNPFGFLSIIAMALTMGLVIFAGRFLAETLGASGAISVSMVSGVFDVDAMTVSMSRLAPATLDARTSALAILAGVASATLGKLVIGALLGGRAFALAVLPLTAASLGSGVVVSWLTGALS